ncbi:MAG: DUF3240 family protein [Methylococcales bacterium]|nr:DUF3240 family protein [Methylococcales bacterium]MDD5630892.1 DUF3240 family protein [Methylococcales bacterium]
MNCKEYLVTLNIPPGIEELMVDSLLMFEEDHGFSSFPVNAHHHINKGLSLAEQVTGRQKRIRFQMYVPVEELPRLLEQLRRDFSGSGIQYWVLPVIENGVI